MAETIKVYGLIALEKTQKPLIEKHCFGDCGKVSMGGVIEDESLGGLLICCEENCPWLLKQTGGPWGTTMSFGRPHEVYLRTLTDTPDARVVAPATPEDQRIYDGIAERYFRDVDASLAGKEADHA